MPPKIVLPYSREAACFHYVAFVVVGAGVSVAGVDDCLAILAYEEEIKLRVKSKQTKQLTS